MSLVRNKKNSKLMNPENLYVDLTAFKRNIHNNLSPYYKTKGKKQYQSSYNLSIHLKNIIGHNSPSKRMLINRIRICSVD